MNFLKSLACLPLLGCREGLEGRIEQSIKELSDYSSDELPGHDSGDGGESVTVKGSIMDTLRSLKPTRPDRTANVVVPPGIYREHLDFENLPHIQNLTLYSNNALETLLYWDQDDHDTVTLGGTNVHITGFTIKHETAAGKERYAVHADKRSQYKQCRWMISCCHLIGNSRKGGLGVGMHGGEEGIVHLTKIESKEARAANLHNCSSPQRLPSKLLFASCDFISHAKPPLGIACGYYNLGSGQSDIVGFNGCQFEGAAGGLRVENRGNGKGESIVLIGESTLETARAQFVDPSKVVKSPVLM